jgi:N-acyl-D-aspartate/D-glutamate deacylase
VPAAGYSQEWYNYMWVETPVLEKNQGLKGKTIGQIAKEQNKRVIDAFLDLVVEENLDTGLMQSENNVDDEAMAKILTYPNAIVGLSDGGAHVQFHGGYGYSTRLLGEWVREKQVMTLEHAVRRLTFDSASALGLYDRGLIRPGMAADIVIFDPDTVRPLPETVVHDFPAGGWRMKEPAAGIMATIVNGEVLIENGRHTGALPGRVLRNTYYHSHA